MTTPVSALILAGGHSSRMGTDKALLPWQGAPMLQRVCQTAAQCCPEVVVLSPWPQRYQSLVPTSVQLLEEATPHQGPLVALQQGFKFISSPWILLLACDLPCLDAQVLRGWMGELPISPHSLLAQVPYRQGRWEPLCGFYHQKCQPLLRAFINQGGRSFQRWLSEISVQKLEVNDAIAPMLRNCNRLSDLE